MLIIERKSKPVGLVKLIELHREVSGRKKIGMDADGVCRCNRMNEPRSWYNIV